MNGLWFEGLFLLKDVKPVMLQLLPDSLSTGATGSLSQNPPHWKQLPVSLWGP